MASDYLGPAHALCRARMEVLAAERDLLQKRLAVYAELPNAADKDWPCTCLKKVDRSGQTVKRAKTPSCPVHGVAAIADVGYEESEVPGMRPLARAREWLAKWGHVECDQSDLADAPALARLLDEVSGDAHRLGYIAGIEALPRSADGHPREVTPNACGEYLGDNDGTCPQLTCIRTKDHAGSHDNVNGDKAPIERPANGYTFEEDVRGTRKVSIYAGGQLRHACEHAPSSPLPRSSEPKEAAGLRARVDAWSKAHTNDDPACYLHSLTALLTEVRAEAIADAAQHLMGEWDHGGMGRSASDSVMRALWKRTTSAKETPR